MLYPALFVIVCYHLVQSQPNCRRDIGRIVTSRRIVDSAAKLLQRFTIKLYALAHDCGRIRVQTSKIGGC
jgi:hypothetical protein